MYVDDRDVSRCVCSHAVRRGALIKADKKKTIQSIKKIINSVFRGLEPQALGSEVGVKFRGPPLGGQSGKSQLRRYHIMPPQMPALPLLLLLPKGGAPLFPFYFTPASFLPFSLSFTLQFRASCSYAIYVTLLQHPTCILCTLMDIN